METGLKTNQFTLFSVTKFRDKYEPVLVDSRQQGSVAWTPSLGVVKVTNVTHKLFKSKRVFYCNSVIKKIEWKSTGKCLIRFWQIITFEKLRCTDQRFLWSICFKAFTWWSDFNWFRYLFFLNLKANLYSPQRNTEIYSLTFSCKNKNNVISSQEMICFISTQVQNSWEVFTGLTFPS